jgi:hypothetical protein
MKLWAKTTALTATACCLLFTTSALAAKAPAATQSRSQVKNPKILFSVSAATGNIRKLGPNQYGLSMHLDDTDKVVVFSSRGNNRLGTHITGKELKTAWQQKTASSFKSDPPNVLLSTNRISQQVAIATAVTATKDTLHFTLRTHKPMQTGQQTGIQLTIDDEAPVCRTDPKCTDTCRNYFPCSVCYDFQTCPELKKYFPKCIGTVRKYGTAKCVW